jgi:DNA-binding transcriptional MerR regulator
MSKDTSEGNDYPDISLFGLARKIRELEMKLSEIEDRLEDLEGEEKNASKSKEEEYPYPYKYPYPYPYKEKSSEDEEEDQELSKIHPGQALVALFRKTTKSPEVKETPKEEKKELSKEKVELSAGFPIILSKKEEDLDTDEEFDGPVPVEIEF